MPLHLRAMQVLLKAPTNGKVSDGWHHGCCASVSLPDSMGGTHSGVAPVVAGTGMPDRN